MEHPWLSNDLEELHLLHVTHRTEVILYIMCSYT